MTIDAVIERLREPELSVFELIIVDDGSTDGTQDRLQCIDPEEATVILRAYNGGKTTAVRDGLDVASGEWIVVQDADLEYDPFQIPQLLSTAQCFVSPTRPAVAVFGRRPSYWHFPNRWLMSAGVLFIDLMILLIYRSWIRDHATCYKLVPRGVLRRFNLESNGFEGCVEITAKLLNSGIPIIQVPIDYVPRTAKEGKKLTAMYGFAALRAIWRFRNWRPNPEDDNEVSAR